MTFTVCTLNLNGIRAAHKKGFGRWLKRTRPDYLCLQELRADRDQVAEDLWSPAGYNTRWNCAEKRGYAGTALYARDAAEGYAVGTGLEWGDREGRFLRGDFDRGDFDREEGGELSVCSLYVPSGSSSEERQEAKFAYLDHLHGFLSELLDEGRPVLVCGDVNIAHTELDIHAPKRNEKNSGFLPEEREWLTRLLDSGWVDVFRALRPGEPGLYSWWSNRGQARAKDRGWRLDYLLASPDLAARATRAWIERRAGLSDHAPVWIEFDGEPAG